MTDWYKIKRVLTWVNGQEKQIYPAEWWWKPWANTVAYYPLQSDTNDYSWNSRNLTNSWVTFVNNIGWATIPVWYWDWGDAAYLNGWNVQLNAAYTVWFRAKVSSSSNVWIIFDLRNNNGNWQGFLLWRCYNNQISFYQQISTYSDQSYSESLTSDWTYWCIRWNWSTWTIYKNWLQDYNVSISNSIDTSASYLWIGCRYYTQTDKYNWYISNVIVENREWTSEEVQEYYNLTKWNYGL